MSGRHLFIFMNKGLHWFLSVKCLSLGETSRLFYWWCMRKKIAILPQTANSRKDSENGVRWPFFLYMSNYALHCFSSESLLGGQGPSLLPIWIFLSRPSASVKQLHLPSILKTYQVYIHLQVFAPILLPASSLFPPLFAFLRFFQPPFFMIQMKSQFVHKAFFRIHRNFSCIWVPLF